MSAIKNDRFLRALRREPVDVTPVWIMRQAGRYLPEYRQVRASVPDFMTLCKTPELAAEVTLQPLKRFDLDAAIIFSDILTVPVAMGMNLDFVEGSGPQFYNPIQNLKDIQALHIPDPDVQLDYVAKAIRHVKPELHVPLIGFSGSPWTLAAYMIEGKSSKDFHRAKRMIYTEPEMMHQLLDRLSQAIILYLRSQIDAGVNAVMLFDTWGGLLSHGAYKTFSLDYMQSIIDALKTSLKLKCPPIIIFTKNGGQWIDAIASSGCDAIGLDWTTSLRDAHQRVGHQVALQGNLDPVILHAPPAVIQRETKTLLQEFGDYSGHIFNLGHGITPDVSPEHVQALIEAVHAKRS